MKVQETKKRYRLRKKDWGFKDERKIRRDETNMKEKEIIIKK